MSSPRMALQIIFPRKEVSSVRRDMIFATLSRAIVLFGYLMCVVDVPIEVRDSPKASFTLEHLCGRSWYL
jgi:hypothetical protein